MVAEPLQFAYTHHSGSMMINFRTLQAVIWDMDGVLIDSEGTHQETWVIALEKFGLPVYRERLKRSFGMTSEMVVQMMVDDPLPEAIVSQICSEKSRLFRNAIKANAVIIPGVKSWLDSFRNNGVLQAVASSGTPENIEIALGKLKIKEYFEVIVSGKNLPSKPEPFIFLKTADMLSVNPLQCLVIEDSLAGVKAAKAAGMKCAAVATTYPVSELDLADIVVANLSHMMIEQIQELFQT